MLTKCLNVEHHNQHEAKQKIQHYLYLKYIFDRAELSLSFCRNVLRTKIISFNE